MRCLIDADVLRYEIGYSAEYKDEEGEPLLRSFDFVAELFDQKIKEIEGECWADEPSLLYLTGKNNFRTEIATVKPYKGNRKGAKPIHYDNLTAYIKFKYDFLETDGYEADDAICIDHLRDPDNTIICTRDKDLRMVNGYHFGWPCGKQPQFGPKHVDYFGELRYDETKTELKGEGIKFFYSQLLTGDSVDNIPGLPRVGAAKTWKLLGELETELELREAVKAAYQDKYEDGWLEAITEQGKLLWMIRERDDCGNLVHWEW